MKSIFSFSSCVVFLFYFICSSVVANEFKSEYLIEVGKIDIGRAYWKVNLTENEYSITIKLKDGGFLSRLYNFEGEYMAFGKIINRKLLPEKYNQRWNTKKKKKNVDIFFKKESLEKLILKPEEQEKARVDYIGIKNHLDPLSSFLNILLGNKDSQTIDGRRIYLMKSKLLTKNKKHQINKITIKNYINIWADHKRNDLDYIEIIKGSGSIEDRTINMPAVIKIKFKNLLFALKKI